MEHRNPEHGRGMKLALVTAEYPPYGRGGAAVSANLLARELRKRGIFVDIYVFDREHPCSETDRGSTRYYHVINSRMWPLVNLQVVSELWKRLNKYDLVHVYPFAMGSLGFMKKIALKAPVVATLNGEEPACINVRRWRKLGQRNCSNLQTIYCAFERAKRTEKVFVPGPVLAAYSVVQRTFAQKLDRYLALSYALKRLYVSHGFPNDKIRVIPNMFDPEFASRLQHLEVEKSREKTIVLYVGRLSPEKGMNHLINAFSAIRSVHAELWIVGTGPEEAKLRLMARKSGRHRDIKFLGYVKYFDLPLVYKRSDIFVNPVGEWLEPFNRTMLEAMLAELPIVASDRGASPEILNGTGLIYHNESELASKIEMLICDDQMRKKLGESAYRKATRDFSPEVVCDHIVAEYGDICSAWKDTGL